jgi:16S rRNA (uracil1498-N3)-methyltransferase
VHAEGERVRLGTGDAHKVTHVLRKHAGDRIVVIDSAGSVFDAVVEDEGSVRLNARIARPTEPAVEVTLAQAIPKGQKMDYVVEKTTELGVARIVPVRSRRVVGATTGAGKVERWRRIAKSAAEQCGRSRIPAIDDGITWEALVATFPAYDAVLFPWEGVEPIPLRERLPALLSEATRVLVIIGPEGGFASDEASIAIDAGAAPIALGPRIFRTETAGIVVLSVVRYETGDL